MKSFYKRDRLGFRLVLASLLIGSVLSVFSTGIQLIASYQRQKTEVSAVLDQVEITLADTLEQALWTFNFDLVDVILDGLAANTAVTHVTLHSSTGQTWSRGEHRQLPLQRVYGLTYTLPDGETQEVGALRVEVSLQAVIDQVWAQFWVTLLTNLAKAYLAALALLYVVHRMITRHLRMVAEHVDGSAATEKTTGLHLDRVRRSMPDDLDRIVQAITRFEERVADTLRSLKSEIKERVKSEKDAREALSVRSSFISTMSQEVRTPLNSILGFLHLIEIDQDVPERQRHYANVATRAARQLLNQLTNVLEMSRLDSKAVTISTRPTAVERLAQQWQETAQALVHFHQKNINVTVDLDDGLDVQYMLDGARVTQIVTNLTDNAAKFTDRGEIRISMREVPALNDPADGPSLEISVADTGSGIKDLDAKRVFDRFTQVDAGMQRVHGGSGLGLAICLELAHLMGAQLSIAPHEKDGFSTEFLLTLSGKVRLDAQNDSA